MCTFALAFDGKRESKEAEIAQLVEHDLAKVGVASSSLVFRSKTPARKWSRGACKGSRLKDFDALVVEW